MNRARTGPDSARAGVTTADFPKAFIAHEFISVAFLALTWAACYQIQPSKVGAPPARAAPRPKVRVVRLVEPRACSGFTREARAAGGGEGGGLFSLSCLGSGTDRVGHRRRSSRKTRQATGVPGRSGRTLRGFRPSAVDEGQKHRPRGLVPTFRLHPRLPTREAPSPDRRARASARE